MAEAQDNTPQAEENSVTNPNTQVEERNDVPYTRFQEVNGQKNQFKSENESLKAELDKVKIAQEDARQGALKKNSEFETLYNEGESKWQKTEEQNKAMQGDLNSFRDGLVNQIPEERRYITDGMSIANLQKFVQDEQVAVNANKTNSSRAGETAKGEFNGYNSKMEWVTKDPESYEKAKNNQQGGKFGNIFTPQGNPFSE